MSKRTLRHFVIGLLVGLPAGASASYKVVEPLPAQGENCLADGRCAAGLSCVKYRSLGGHENRSCEIPCPKADDKCPKGQSCIRIADGPGPVCRK